MFRMSISVFTLVSLCSAAVAAGPSTAPRLDPLKFLSQSLADPDKADQTLSALRATGDKDLAPLLRALATSGNKDWRLFSISSLAEVVGKDAADTFADRLKNDPSMVVRDDALIALIALKACTKQHLLDAMASPDENVQCIAARTAVLQGFGDAAVETLKKLTSSRDKNTAAMSRMSLLKFGQADQLAPLREIVKDPGGSDPLLGTKTLLMEQIAEEKIEAAAELAKTVAESNEPWQLRVRAYRALSAVSPKAGKIIADAIKNSKDTGFRVHMLKVLASRDDSAGELAILAKGDAGDSAAVLARLELARKSGGDAAAKAANEAVEIGHPVVVKYLLDLAGEDIAARGKDAAFYAQPLLALIRSIPADPDQVDSRNPVYVQGARAATLLADLGADDGVNGLKSILAGKYSANVRVTATGLMRTRKKVACDLMRPLLKSPYPELSSDAALVMGRFADPDGTAVLSAIADDSGQHSQLLLTMANWYLLKLANRSTPAAEALAKEIK